MADDSPINRKLLLALLDRLGYPADAVCDGLACLKALSERRYGLVLMDCQMPALDGYEAAHRIRAGKAGVCDVQAHVWIGKYRKFKATTQSRHNLPVAPNRRVQDFTATAANQKWVADITYIWTEEGWLILGSRTGPVSPRRGRMGHGGADDAGACDRCPYPGHLAPSARARPFRPG